MDCAACPSIVKAVWKPFRRCQVTVSFKDKTATVIYDEAKPT